MLPRHRRLDRKTFSEVFQNGQRLSLPHVTLIGAPGVQKRVAVVVSKKVAKTAVRRNKLRRDVYEIISVFPKQHGALIVLLKPQSIRAKREALAEEILSGYTRLLGRMSGPR